MIYAEIMSEFMLKLSDYLELDCASSKDMIRDGLENKNISKQALG